MARRQLLRPKRAPRVSDEYGGFADGGLAIVNVDGRSIHITSSRVATALRYFLARVEMHGSQGLPQRVALTAALLGEGVTYVTRSLASVIAYDTDASVLVVDMNWRRPSSPSTDGRRKRDQGKSAKSGTAGKSAVAAADEAASTDVAAGEPDVPSSDVPARTDDVASPDDTAGPDDTADKADTEIRAEAVSKDDERPVAPQLGLVDVVERGAALEDVIIRTINPRLSLLAAGEVPVSRRPALAASSDLAAVLDRLDEQFDYLLLDLPPVLATSEAMNLSQFADSSVLIVRQGATSESQVEAALEEMQGVEVLGVILNRFSTKIPKRLRRLVGT